MTAKINKISKVKVNKVKLGTKIPKTLHDDLMRHASDNNIYITDIIETAVREYIHPYEKENHEKHTKMQLATIINRLIGIANRQDISLCCFEELIKTFYRSIPELVIENDPRARVALNARIAEVHAHFLTRVFDSGLNDEHNILSIFNTKKI